jgi:hypothetical protein
MSDDYPHLPSTLDTGLVEEEEESERQKKMMPGNLQERTWMELVLKLVATASNLTRIPLCIALLGPK